MTTTALTVIDRKTGELLDVRDAETERLAEFTEGVDELVAELRDSKHVVLRELVRRLDRDGTWTQRVPDAVGPDGVQYEITAASPNAGTTSYPPDLLEAELVALIDRGTISETGASKALVRTLAVELRVPWSADPDELAARIMQAAEIQVAGVTVEVVKAEGKRSTKLPGVNALAKVPGTGAALDRARVTVPVGERLAKVKAKTKAGA